MREVVLYVREGCHLCDDAREALLSVRAEAPFTLREVDVEGDPALEAAYGIRIPVVLVDGEEVFEYRVDVEEARRVLA